MLDYHKGSLDSAVNWLETRLKFYYARTLNSHLDHSRFQRYRMDGGNLVYLEVRRSDSQSSLVGTFGGYVTRPGERNVRLYVALF